MDERAWGLILGVLSIVGLVTYITKLINDNRKKDNLLIDLEYKEEKVKLEKSTKNDSIDSVIARISKRILSRLGK